MFNVKVLHMLSFKPGNACTCACYMSIDIYVHVQVMMMIKGIITK